MDSGSPAAAKRMPTRDQYASQKSTQTGQIAGWRSASPLGPRATGSTGAETRAV
jgi:hypothetical protein